MNKSIHLSTNKDQSIQMEISTTEYIYTNCVFSPKAREMSTERLLDPVN